MSKLNSFTGFHQKCHLTLNCNLISTVDVTATQNNLKRNDLVQTAKICSMQRRFGKISFYVNPKERTVETLSNSQSFNGLSKIYHNNFYTPNLRTSSQKVVRIAFSENLNHPRLKCDYAIKAPF